MSAANFKSHGLNGEDPEVSSPLKPKKEANKNGQVESKSLSPEVENNTMSKGKWKKIAREKGKAQEVEKINKGPEVGKKRLESIEALTKAEGRDQKWVCGEDDNKNSIFLDEMAMATRQHRREK